MEVSRKSWHYRMNAWCWSHFGKSPAPSLCGYFWQTVFAPVVVVAFYAAILTVILVICSWLFYFSGAFLCNFLHWINVLPDSFDIVPGEFNWRHLIVSLIMSALLIGHFALQNRQNKNSKPNFVFEYIKAKKNKICPIIEYKD